MEIRPVNPRGIVGRKSWFFRGVGSGPLDFWGKGGYFFSGGFFGFSAAVPLWPGVSGLAVTCRFWGLCHPPTDATEHLSYSLAPSIPVYGSGWPSPLWWQLYSINIRMSWSRVSSTWWWGGCPAVSTWPPLWYTAVLPMRRQKLRNFFLLEESI